MTYVAEPVTATTIKTMITDNWLTEAGVLPEPVILIANEPDEP